MDTMRREMIWAGGLLVCVLAVAIGARAADSGSVKVESDTAESAVILLEDVSPDRLIRLPDTYTVKRRYPDGHPMQNALAGAAESCALEETKAIYTSKLGTFAFRPGRGRRIADDLTTELVRDCSICSLRVRVTGGVEGGGGTFLADFSLFDGCPASGQGGQEIPGSRLRFRDLEDDADLFHDLIIEYSDRGICDDGSSCLVSQQNCTGGTCDDGSACDTDDPNCGDGSECLSSGFVCVEDPLEIPPTVWVRFRFDTDDAIVVMGSPPTRGFSADAFDDPQAFCTAWFGGWPTFPHATMFAEILAPATCETHFLAYLAANPNRPAFLPGDIGPIPIPGGGTRPPFTTPTTRLGDDITLTVDNCILSAYELGMKGNAGEFTMEIDLRWPDVNTIRTEATFIGRGEGSAEVAHFTIDEDLNLSIGPNDQPIVMTWKSDKADTGAIEVDTTQGGSSQPTMLAFDVDPQNRHEWSIVPDGDFTPAVFYAAIFCRGDPPRGACCPDQPDIPGSDTNCFDDVPVASCLGMRWQINSTCQQNVFNPPCGTHSCCLPTGHCEDRTFDDCVEECITDVDPVFCEPVCNGGENDRQPCNPANGHADCAPDGICDPDASCPGQRTCGLTGCQLDGAFTGRPCELDNPDRGAADCMTCSGSGEYCRPRCTDGLRRGRPCDDNTDCPGGTCDNNVDCPMGHKCKSIQTCEHDANQCGLRCARWSAGEFCSQNGVEEDCLFDPGACCLGTDCSIATEFLCLESGGTFFGPGTACDTPDADGDGLRDECDRCPADSNKFEPGICGCGVDDTDDSDSPLFLGEQYAAGSIPSSVAIGDLDGDQVPDLAVANLLGDVSVLLGVGDGMFATAVNYAAGGSPGSIAIGDLDGNHVPDLAVANSRSDNVSVLLGVGDGTFAAAVQFAAGDRPQSLAMGDLDGDGVPDLAVANRFDVSVLLGVGDGTLAAAVQYAVGGLPTSVAIGDLDGDQVPDLAVTTRLSYGVSVLLGVGAGTFATAAQYAVNGSPTSVAIGDLNGDGVPDLAVANRGTFGGASRPDTVSVLLGLGDGTFAVAVPYAGVRVPESVAIGDLDGDRVPDLAVANDGPHLGSLGNVSVLLGVGDGTFAAAVHYTAGFGPDSVVIGDLNADQRPDLVVANSSNSNVSVLLNQASGGCNRNGIPDECDIDCGAPGGPCDLPCCGVSVDCNGNGVPDDCELDSDGDGFIDDCDACLDSDLAKLILVGECPTGVTNELLDDGCTMNDVLSECSLDAHSHGQLTACVARQANEWRRQGLLSGKDVGRIAHCAGTSKEPRTSKRIKDGRSRGGR